MFYKALLSVVIVLCGHSPWPRKKANTVNLYNEMWHMFEKQIVWCTLVIVTARSNALIAHSETPTYSYTSLIRFTHSTTSVKRLQLSVWQDSYGEDKRRAVLWKTRRHQSIPGTRGNEAWLYHGGVSGFIYMSAAIRAPWLLQQASFHFQICGLSINNQFSSIFVWRFKFLYSIFQKHLTQVVVKAGHFQPFSIPAALVDMKDKWVL